MKNPSAGRVGDLEGPRRFLAPEELAQQVVEDFTGNLDDVLVSGDGELGLVHLGQHMALDEHGVAVSDDNTGAHAVGAAPRRVVVDDFHHPTLPHLFRGSVQSISGKFTEPNFGIKPQG